MSSRTWIEASMNSRNGMKQRIIIVGAGQSGARTAASLRKQGSTDEIVLIGDEAELPYERPPLSKEILGGAPLSGTVIFPSEYYAKHGIDVRVSTRVSAIEPASRQIVFADASRLVYDHLVLATGVRARRLAIPGAELDGVLTLRTAQDSARLSARLTPNARIVILGGGFLGLEIAAAAVKRGCAVTVVESAAVLLGRILGGFLGEHLAELHRSHGVDIRTNARIKAIEGRGSVSGIVLEDGTTIPADTVVVAVGALANDELAKGAGIECADGVLVDAHTRTSVAGIYAVGDVARQRERWSVMAVRLESWENAELQAQAVACTILGVPVSGDAAPWFWTDQYDQNIQILGGCEPDDDVVMRGDAAAPSWCSFFVRRGRLHGAVLMNAGRERRIVKQIMDARQIVDCGVLGDPGRPLKSLVTA
jgi:3-phenylpropionate/trans-cinnamate dioxygenase ferredoxin reductase subunit